MSILDELATARQQYAEALAALSNARKAETLGQGSQRITRQQLDQHQRDVQFWQGEVRRLERLAAGRSRSYRAIPRDL